MVNAGDAVRARRARIARAASTGQRAGYGLFALAMAVFVAGALTGFPSPLTTLVVAFLTVGSLLLAPSIVLGYAVKAAERDDRRAGH